MLIGLSGYAQSGKDTVASILVDKYSFKRISFADAIRNALLTLNPKIDSITHLSDLVDDYGWDVAKQNSEVRRLMQVFGSEVGRKMWSDTFWIDQAFKHITDGVHIFNGNFVFADVRFPNEAEAIKNKDGKIWRVNRHNFSAVNSHISERAMDNWMFDDVIYNDGTLEELTQQVEGKFKQ